MEAVGYLLGILILVLIFAAVVAGIGVSARSVKRSVQNFKE